MKIKNFKSEKQEIDIDLSEIFSEIMESVRVVLSDKELLDAQNQILRLGGAKYLQKEFNINRHTSYQYISGRRKLPLRVYLRTKQNKKELHLKLLSSNSRTIKLPFYINPDIAYLVGALRDGWLIQTRSIPFGIGIHQKTQDWLTGTIAPILEKNFSIKPTIRGRNLIVYSEILGYYLTRCLNSR